MQLYAVLDALAQAAPLLTDGCKVDVVLEGEVGTQLSAERLQEPPPTPSREVVSQSHLIAGGLEDPGAPDGGDGHLPPSDAGVGGQGVSDLADLRDQRIGAACTGALIP